MTNATASLAKGNTSSAYARSLRRTSAGAKGRGHKVYGGPWPGVSERAVQPEQRTPVRAPEQQTRLQTFQHARGRPHPQICACESASKHVDQRGRHAVPELQLPRHNAMPPTCVSQSLQTDERRQARRSERTETHAWADVGAFRHTRRQRTHTCRRALFRWRQTCHICGMHAHGS